MELHAVKVIKKIISDLTRLYLFHSAVYIGELNLITFEYKHKLGYNWLDKDKLTTNYIEPALEFIKLDRKISIPIESFTTLSKAHPRIFIWIYFPYLISSKNIRDNLLNKLLHIVKQILKSNKSGIEKGNIGNDILEMWNKVKKSEEFKLLHHSNEEFKKYLYIKQC